VRSRTRATGSAAIVIATMLGLAACGTVEGGPVTESGGLASTSTTTQTEGIGRVQGPLDREVAKRIGALRLDRQTGTGQLRESGAEDARTLDYRFGKEDVVVGIALWPTAGRARWYARRFASTLEADQHFRAGSEHPFDSRRGHGVLIRLTGGPDATDAIALFGGRLSATALGSKAALEQLLTLAPWGAG
jgi:hypothetical protein